MKLSANRFPGAISSRQQPQKCGARQDDNKDENESAPDVLPLRHGSNLLQRSERDCHPDQTEGGEGKGIISGERHHPERLRPQTQSDDRGHDKSKKQPMVRIYPYSARDQLTVLVLRFPFIDLACQAEPRHLLLFVVSNVGRDATPCSR